MMDHYLTRSSANCSGGKSSERRKRNNPPSTAAHFYQASNGQSLTTAETQRTGFAAPPSVALYLICDGATRRAFP